MGQMARMNTGMLQHTNGQQQHFIAEIFSLVQVPDKVGIHQQFCSQPATLHVGCTCVLRPHQHSIGYTGNGFYRSKRPNQQYQSTEGKSAKENNPDNKENTKYTCIHTKC